MWQPPRLLRDWDSLDANEGRKISWAELFVDLVFVTTIAKLGESLRAMPAEGDFLSVWHYILYFALLWFTWTRMTAYATRFHNDDLSHKVFLFAYMVSCIGIAMHTAGGVAGDNVAGFAAAQLGVCCVLLVLYARVVYHIPRARHFAGMAIGTEVVIAMLWGMIFLIDDVSTRERLMWSIVALQVSHLLSLPIASAWIKSVPKLMVPLHLDHFTERYGLFILIVLGETINGIAQVAAMPTAEAVKITQDVLAPITDFDINVVDATRHALRRHRLTGVTWGLSHPILACATAMVGSGLELVAITARMGNGAANSDAQAQREERGRALVGLGTSVILVAIAIQHTMHARPVAVNPSLDTTVRKIWIAQYCIQIASAVGISALTLLSNRDTVPDLWLLACCATTLLLLVLTALAQERALALCEAKGGCVNEGQAHRATMAHTYTHVHASGAGQVGAVVRSGLIAHDTAAAQSAAARSTDDDLVQALPGFGHTQSGGGGGAAGLSDDNSVSASAHIATVAVASRDVGEDRGNRTGEDGLDQPLVEVNAADDGELVWRPRVSAATAM